MFLDWRHWFFKNCPKLGPKTRKNAQNGQYLSLRFHFLIFSDEIFRINANVDLANANNGRFLIKALNYTKKFLKGCAKSAMIVFAKSIFTLIIFLCKSTEKLKCLRELRAWDWSKMQSEIWPILCNFKSFWASCGQFKSF